jgi:hypothetical protein
VQHAPSRLRPPRQGGRLTQLLVVTAPTIVGRAGNFLALVVLGTLVTAEEYGQLVVLQTVLLGISSILVSSSSLSLNAATARIRGVRDLPVTALYRAALRGRRRVIVTVSLAAAVLVPIGHGVLGGAVPSIPGSVAVAAVSATSGFLLMGDAVVAVVTGSGRYVVGSCVEAGRAVAGGVGTLIGTVTLGPVAGVAGMILPDALLVGVILLVGLRRRHPGVPDLRTGSANEGTGAGVLSNALGQVTQWLLLFGVQATGGPAAVGVYGAANRFASLVTILPLSFGKTVLGQLAGDGGGRGRWTSRSFMVVLSALSLATAVLAFAILLVGFPALAQVYEHLERITALLLAASVLRALLMGAGYICVARRRWTTWVLADLTSMAVTVIGLVVVWTLGADLGSVIVVYGLANAAGLAVRIVGSSNRRRS